MDQQDELKPHRVLGFFERVRDHLQRLVEASGGEDEVFHAALRKLEDVMASPDPVKGLMKAGGAILSFLDEGYTAQIAKIESDLAQLDRNAQKSDEKRVSK